MLAVQPWCRVLLLGVWLQASLVARAAETPASGTPAGSAEKSAAAAEAPPPLKPEELDQLVAPIALYPDALLAQVLMASTYPLEIVQAARWAEQHKDLNGDEIEQAAQEQAWDPSVKSLTPFPQVLAMMNERLDWTQKLGDAFLAQEAGVMDAVQRLRAKAKSEGNLANSSEQTVESKTDPATSKEVIVIQSADPQVVYVPTYNPTTVYGAWPTPAYPPYPYYPPGVALATSAISFGVGVAVGSAMWGGVSWGWGGSHVDVDVNNYNRVNRTNIQSDRWQHNAEHRRGVQYRDPGSRERYGREFTGSDTRQAYRGRTERPAGERQRPETRPTGERAQRAESRPQREAGAFEGAGNGREARAESARGHASRQSGGFGGGGGRGGGGRGGGRGGRR